MQQPTCEPPKDGRSDRSGGVQSLLRHARRLRTELGDARRVNAPGGSDLDRWQRALYDLADRQLRDLSGYLGELSEAAEDAEDAAEAGEPQHTARFSIAELAAAPSPGEVLRLGRLGTAEWDLVQDRVVWSPETYRMLGRAEEDGPLTLDQLPAHLFPDDQQHFAGMVTTSLVDGRALDGELRVTRPDGRVRTLHCVGEPVPSEDGTFRSLWMLLRDVSELRRDQRSLRETRETLIRERRTARAELRRTVELQHQVLPDWPSPHQLLDGVELAGDYLPSPALDRVGGDWYDALALPDGDILLTFGGVSGHGPAAAAAMAAVRSSLRAVAVGGARPPAVLSAADRLLAAASAQDGRQDGAPHDPTAYGPGGGEQLAAALCLRYRPDTRMLSWSRAGHPAPLLFRPGARGVLRALPLDRLGGRAGLGPLGAGSDWTDGANGPLLGTDVPGGDGYPPLRARLRPGDLLLCHSDGLVRGRTRYPGWQVERLLGLAPALGREPSARRCLELARAALLSPEHGLSSEHGLSPEHGEPRSAAASDAHGVAPASAEIPPPDSDDLCLLAARIC